MSSTETRSTSARKSSCIHIEDSNLHTRKSSRLNIEEQEKTVTTTTTTPPPDDKSPTSTTTPITSKKAKRRLTLVAKNAKEREVATFEDFDKPEFSLRQLPDIVLSRSKLDALHNLCIEYAK